MKPVSADEPTKICHVVAMPYPGRGHVNPMMNLCKLLSAKKPDILISFVITEEWLGFIGDQSKPENVQFRTIPNVIPSEIGRANDFPGFVEAVSTKLETPFDGLLDQLETAPDVIVVDTYLVWMVGLANRRNIPVASLWTMSAIAYSEILHFDLFQRNGFFPLPEEEDERLDHIPGVASTRVSDLIGVPNTEGTKYVLAIAREAIDWVKKAQYLLFTSFYELESHTIDTFKSIYKFPVYCIGPSIPYLESSSHSSLNVNENGADYFNWLNAQPEKSVLYVSYGSFLSTSKAQMEEFVAGIKDSNVRFLWVARGGESPIKENCSERGMVVPWCDQMKVLCHSSIGGFWSHCGWNSTLEAVYAGVPLLASPIFWDQIPNSKLISEDWKIGLRLRSEGGNEKLLKREEIADILKRFMDGESEEGKEMRKRMKELKEVCKRAIAKGGSSDSSVDDLLSNIIKAPTNS